MMDFFSQHWALAIDWVSVHAVTPVVNALHIAEAAGDPREIAAGILIALAAPVALLMFLLGTGWYVWTFFTMHRFTNMSALLYTGSVITFMMGLISEQITALMYKDAK